MGTSKVFRWVDRRCNDAPVCRDRRTGQSRRLVDSQMTRTALDWLYRYRWVPWWVMAFVFAAVILPDLVDPIRFFIRPVVTMKGELVSKTSDVARVHIFGKKHRGIECEYLGIQAFGDRLVGLPADLIIKRVDMPSDGISKPQGTYDIGIWELRPMLGVTTARVYVSHNCEGVRIATKVAEVPI